MTHSDRTCGRRDTMKKSNKKCQLCDSQDRIRTNEGIALGDYEIPSMVTCRFCTAYAIKNHIDLGRIKEWINSNLRITNTTVIWSKYDWDPSTGPTACARHGNTNYDELLRILDRDNDIHQIIYRIIHDSANQMVDELIRA